MKIILFALSFPIFAEPVSPAHLMFNQKDIPDLREKFKSGMPKRAYERMLERCNKSLSLSVLAKYADEDMLPSARVK